MRNSKAVALNHDVDVRLVPSKLSRAITAAIFGLGVSVASTGVNAASLQVTSNNDSSGSSSCTLRQAIDSVNQGEEVDGCVNSSLDDFGTDDTITFASSNSIALTAGELLIESDVTIDATSISGITVKSITAARVMNVSNMASVSLNQVTVRGGNAADYGGGVLVDAGSALSLTDSTITANAAPRGAGIALGLGAELTVIDSQISSNTATYDSGGVYLIYYNSMDPGASISLTGTTLQNNAASDGFGGGFGGFASNVVLNLTNSTVAGNNAYTFGGGIYLGGDNNVTTIIGGEVNNNSAGSSGGGISVYGSSPTFSMTGTSISNNDATDYGGGLSVTGLTTIVGSSVTLANAMFEDNRSTGVPLTSTGAGLYASTVALSISGSTFNRNVASGFGGAMFVLNSELALSTSTLSSNSAGADGGGLYSDDSSLSLTSSTFVSNSAGSYGGGIRSVDGSLLLTNSTLSSNTALVSGGGLYNDTAGARLQLMTITNNYASSKGAGVFDLSQSLTLQNSIIANSTSAADCYGVGVGGVIVDTASIIEDGSCAATRNGDPSLLPLADNGGPTETHALDTPSIAINTGNNTNCLAQDQRGELRSDGRCDVGSFEEPSPQEDGDFIVIPIDGGKKVVVFPN